MSGPGTSTSDSVHARLSHGEFVMQASAVQAWGRSTMEAMNARRYADGGIVGPSAPLPSLAPPSGGGGGGPITMHLNQRTEVTLNSQKVGTAFRTESLTFQRRNPQNNLSLLRR